MAKRSSRAITPATDNEDHALELHAFLVDALTVNPSRLSLGIVNKTLSRSHYEAAARSLQILAEAKAICEMITEAMCQGSPDDDDVCYAVAGVSRLLDKGIDISSMLDEEMRADLEKGGR